MNSQRYGFRMDALDVDGAWVFTPRIHRDRRGSFLEWFRNAEVLADIGRSLDVAQANCSVSMRGAIRGVHFSDVPPGQAKYVTCVSGSILDVVVDLRVGSPGYGRWAAVPLNAESRCAVFIAEGLGHGFITLSDKATVLYMCSTPYAPAHEHASGACGGYAVPATPTTLPSGSVKWPTTRPVGARSGPIRRVPPRLSAFCNAASTSGTPM